jgi:ubiquinone/menaquinone biosynthesis methyltransferase
MRSAARLRAPEDRRDTPPTTHFGYRDVPQGDKAKMVGEVFSRVAASYDLMNDLMSAGVHRVWKDHFVHGMGLPSIQAASTAGVRVLDVAGGTGDIAFRIADALAAGAVGAGARARAEITVYDINADMLRVGEERARGRAQLQSADAPALRWVQGDAEKLPFEDDSFDLYSIAFGIRNVTTVPNALREAHRVLRPGGRFVCLEFSQVEHPLLRALYDEYSFRVIPALGGVVANDKESYQYLVESIRKFPNQPAFAEWIREAGFKGVSYTNLTAGVVAMHTGFKV